MPAGFQVPGIVENEEGWGPTSVPEHLEGVPYAPYGKGDKVGRVSDFTQSGFNKYGGRYGNQNNMANYPQVFNFSYNEDEDSFHLVDNKPAQRKQGMRRFQPNRFHQQRRDQQQREEMTKHQDRQPRKQQQKRPQFFHRNDQRQVVHSSSVDIRPEWAVVEQIPFTSLSKLNYQAPPPEDLETYGALEYYDKAFDRVTPKTEKPLRKTRRVFRNVTTSDDPIIRKYAQEEAAQVFITDTLLTTLMCTPRSVYSWDIVITCAGGRLFFDKRDGSSLDLLTVAETSPEQIAEDKDNINGVQQLSLEATALNQNFSQQVLLQGGAKVEYEPNPFASEGGDELAAVAYRYRKFNLGENVELVVRSELDGVMNYKGQDQLLSIKALNEFDPKHTGVDWRQKMENQRGAVLATELKNNANKLAKWTAAALVSGADMIKLGYVSRVHMRDNFHHAVLGTQVMKPKDFAQQINLNMDNCWGIVRALVDLCMKQEDGKYLLVKDPNKQLLRLYSVPEDAFQENYTEEPIAEMEEVPTEEPTKADGGEED